MDREELALFLRTRRERMSPADLGLAAGSRRRTPGLRREEVAQSAYLSTVYYTKLEQGRGSRPSLEVLHGLCRALKLSDPERDHLHQLAGWPPTRLEASTRVRPSILSLMNRLPDAAIIVVSAAFEVIAWNELATALMEDFSALPRRDRNLARLAFIGPHHAGQRLYGVSDIDEFTRYASRRLRSTAARYPDDPSVAELISELRAKSGVFARLWESHDVSAEVALSKTFQHRLVGPITVGCDVLDIADQDQQLVIYTAAPGSPAEKSLQLISGSAR